MANDGALKAIRRRSSAPLVANRVPREQSIRAYIGQSACQARPTVNSSVSFDFAVKCDSNRIDADSRLATYYFIARGRELWFESLDFTRAYSPAQDIPGPFVGGGSCSIFRHAAECVEVASRERERHEDVEGTERTAVAGIGGGWDLAAGGWRGVCGGSRRTAEPVGVGPAAVGVAGDGQHHAVSRWAGG